MLSVGIDSVCVCGKTLEQIARCHRLPVTDSKINHVKCRLRACTSCCAGDAWNNSLSYPAIMFYLFAIVRRWMLAFFL